ncbi:hypothetical protein [Homoserinimonas hongtaonis]|uniref:hypothetical protein n=1 Tax=Homoserinimonas hongtaonis TaxID=2079791 RepID=UPI00131EE930|nr:hypothetical protein [Salinibacterium hongtaonis]
MYVSVGPGNGPPATFEIGRLVATTAEDGTRVLTAAISNTGGRALDLSGTLSLTEGPAGLSAGPFDGHKSLTVAPGRTGQMSVMLEDAIPEGPWLATLQVRSGLIVQDLTSEITFSNDARAEGDPRIRASYIIVATVLAVAIVASLLLWNRRRLRKAVSLKVLSP